MKKKRLILLALITISIFEIKSMDEDLIDEDLVVNDNSSASAAAQPKQPANRTSLEKIDALMGALQIVRLGIAPQQPEQQTTRHRQTPNRPRSRSFHIHRSSAKLTDSGSKPKAAAPRPGPKRSTNNTGNTLRLAAEERTLRQQEAALKREAAKLAAEERKLQRLSETVARKQTELAEREKARAIHEAEVRALLDAKGPRGERAHPKR